ncbi:hypothetical protein Tco_0978695 [Tanacetum coccineum]|uniref:Uncharacterized protein n=1 Tax=Tanacetum coccineum TaxID=301880 RepID=A0ABQ5EP45_9ASTR
MWCARSSTRTDPVSDMGLRPVSTRTKGSEGVNRFKVLRVLIGFSQKRCEGLFMGKRHLGKFTISERLEDIPLNLKVQWTRVMESLSDEECSIGYLFLGSRAGQDNHSTSSELRHEVQFRVTFWTGFPDQLLFGWVTLEGFTFITVNTEEYHSECSGNYHKDNA